MPRPRICEFWANTVSNRLMRTRSLKCESMIVSGEVAELLMRELRTANPAVSCKVVLDELDAITEVLEEVRCGATAILFYERLEPVQALLQKAGAQPVEAPDRPGQLTAASRRSAARPGRTGPAAG